MAALRSSSLWRYAVGAAGIGLLTLAMLPWRTHISAANAALLYLLVVLVCATRLGLGSALLASVLAFVAFNFFFVPPLHTLFVSEPQDVLRLVLFLIVAMLASSLSSQARAQADTAARQAAELAALYELSQAVSAENELERSLALVAATTARLLDVPSCAILLYDERGLLVERVRFGVEPGSTFRRSDVFLRVGARVMGVIRVSHPSLRARLTPNQHNLIDTIAALVVQLLERTRLAEAASQTRALAESDRLKSALLSSVSHDLRTPLAVIKGAASDLLDAEVVRDGQSRAELYQAINDGADRLNRVVGNLLEMSRIDAGALARTRSWYDLGELVTAVVERMRGQLRGRPVRLSVPEALPLVLCNYTQIDLVVTNVLENAIKYAPDASAITLELRATAHTVELSISDEGPGIPHALMPNLFERFVRGGAPEWHGEGSGLGLAICKGIVEAHAGRIWAENLAGHGARFTMSLPRGEPTPRAEPVAPVRDTQELHS
jgi:two-component system sensor histidine kinase KdpD